MNQKLNEREFTPDQAFFLAMEDAIAKTAQSLLDIGLDQEMVWNSFRRALVELVADVADGTEQWSALGK